MVIGYGLWVIDTCSCETEVPFGRSRNRFNVSVVVFRIACCFRLGREAKRNPMPARVCAGGWQVWEMSHLVPSIQHLRRRHFHPVECEQLLSQVFEGRAEVIDGVVDDEEAVVVAVALPNRNGRILPVVAFEIKGQRFRDVFRDNLRRHALFPFRQHQQHRIVHIVVDEGDTFLRRTDQVGGEGVCVKDLPVVEDAFDRRKGGAYEKADLLLRFADTLLQSFDPLVDGVSAKKILFENGVRPSAEHDALWRFHSVSY